MKFKLEKDKFLNSKTYVWYGGYCIGFFRADIKINNNIDWGKYRKDKTLKLDPKDRFITSYIAFCYPNISCGQALSKKEAVISIFNKQKELYNLLDTSE